MNNPYLVGKNVYLRPVEFTDAPLIQTWHNDPELRKLGGNPKLLSTKDTEEEDIQKAYKSDDEAYLMIVKKANNDAIGFIRLNRLTSRDRNVWLRMVIGDKASWGKGYGSQVLRAVSHWIFNELNVHRVECETYATNEGALKFFKRMGFKKEGVHRQAHFTEGKYEDIISFGILREEFHYEGK